MNLEAFLSVYFRQSPATNESKLDVQTIRSFLNEVSAICPAHQKFAENIWKEAHLTKDAWQSFVELIVTFVTNGTPHTEFSSSARNLFRTLLLRGENINVRAPRYMRVIPALTFATLVTQYTKLAAKDAMAYVAKLAVGVGTQNKNLTSFVYRSSLARIPLGRFIMWSSFKADDGMSPNLPDLLDRGLGGVQCCLGLPECRFEHLYFEYELPSTVVTHYPSICDAYAAEDLNTFFRPCEPDWPHGRTVPHAHCADPACGVAECVHEVVNADNLVSRPVSLTP
jgi:hypothetical protein